MDANENSTGTVKVRGTAHHYEWVRLPASGSAVKPVLVFVHGWGGSGRYWRTTARALAHRFDCLIYDLRGFGRSSGVGLSEGDYALEAYAEDLLALLDELGLGRVYINAHSMGASIATLFASRYPQRVERLILTCSGIFSYDPVTFPLFHRAGTYVVKFRFGWFKRVPTADRLFMARFLHRPIAAAERRAFLEDFLQAEFAAATGTIYTSVSKHAAEVMPQAFADLRVPTLLVAGEKDIIIPARLGQRAAALNLEWVEYYEIPRTAHFPMLEDRDEYLQKVNDFLAS